jgi:hypothetical protein
VQEIETTVGEDDGFAGSSRTRGDLGDFVETF